MIDKINPKLVRDATGAREYAAAEEQSAKVWEAAGRELVAYDCRKRRDQWLVLAQALSS